MVENVHDPPQNPAMEHDGGPRLETDTETRREIAMVIVIGIEVTAIETVIETEIGTVTVTVIETVNAIVIVIVRPEDAARLEISATFAERSATLVGTVL
jgi:hypothetical protein